MIEKKITQEKKNKKEKAVIFYHFPMVAWLPKKEKEKRKSLCYDFSCERKDFDTRVM